jgi:hypothetical protein
MADEPLAERPDAVVEDLPPSAHPPVGPEDPKPLDDMQVPPLTDPDETRGG